METRNPLTHMAAIMPELPCRDVERAQRHYRDHFGFEILWINQEPEKFIGAVNRGETTIFLRKRTTPFEPAVHWVFCMDVDATYQEFVELGATIAEPISNKPWGLRQFTLHDLDGNIFYFHHDLPVET